VSFRHWHWWLRVTTKIIARLRALIGIGETLRVLTWQTLNGDVSDGVLLMLMMMMININLLKFDNHF
jgi:hypothetical protein